MSESKTATILQPREGMLGVLDRIVGPGAARWEIAGTMSFAAIGALVAPALLHRQQPDSSPIELAVASAIGKDLGGGVWCTETPSAKRWYQRQDSTHLGRIGFAALHVYPFMVEAASGRGDWRSAAISYSTLVAGAATLELTPTDKRRSVATGLYTAWLAGTTIVAPSPSGYAWMSPLLGFKLLVGHGTPRGPLSALRRRPKRLVRR
jgi:hypothetical protein